MFQRIAATTNAASAMAAKKPMTDTRMGGLRMRSPSSLTLGGERVARPPRAASSGLDESGARALDRVLLHNHYVVPQWGSGVTRTVRWNRFGRPPQMPRYAAPAFPSIWWYDEGLAAKTGGNR